jgi:hypothetical protein
MTIYGKLFFIGLIAFLHACVYVSVSDDKSATGEAPLITTSNATTDEPTDETKD